jgi:hypothetical protein
MTSIPQPTKSIKTVLQNYPADKYNLLYPSESAIDISPIFEIIEEVVRINPDPKQQEVFDAGSFQDGGKWITKLGLSKTALEKLSYAAGIVFDSMETGQVPTDRPKEIQFKVQGALQKLDGTYVRATKTKTVNLIELEKEQRERLEAKALQGDLKKDRRVLEAGTKECNDYIEGALKLFMIKETKDAPQKAETGAYNRVIRSLLGLRPYYTEKDLQKPFVVIKVALNTAVLMMDASTRQMVLMNALNAQTNVFGRLPAPEMTQRLLNANVIEINDDDPDEISKPITAQASSEVSHQPSAEDIERENLEHWTTAPPKVRLDEIKRLVDLKKYVPQAKALLTPETLDAENQAKYIMFLGKQSDPQPEPEKMDWDKKK